ncbi:hypothetical protein GGH12_005597 [Coemansia sp. RSA 1822]|nr:hypothetical protein GGH12_005597 [Coemansia sp. RSA 1822]
MFAYIFALLFALLLYAYDLAAAHHILAVVTSIAWLYASRAPANVPAAVVAELQQRLDAEKAKCTELENLIAQQKIKQADLLEKRTALQRLREQNRECMENYISEIASKERQIEEVKEKLLAATNDRNAKIEEDVVCLCVGIAPATVPAAVAAELQRLLTEQKCEAAALLEGYMALQSLYEREHGFVDEYTRAFEQLKCEYKKLEEKLHAVTSDRDAKIEELENFQTKLNARSE